MEFACETQEIKTNASTEALRAKIRNYSRNERFATRAAANDTLRFGLGEITKRIEELDSLNEKDVKGLATRIKRRKHATLEDMYRLSHAFLQSNDNINAFANTPGAIEVLVKELISNDSDRQVTAAECLCNISLGEAHVCKKISNAAGAYFMLNLDSINEPLKRTSLWTLANIFATSLEATKTLLKMELVRKLWSDYIKENGEYCEDAAICLQLITILAKQRQLLQESDWQFIFENFHTKSPKSLGSEYHLQIVFQCELVHPQRLLTEMQILYLISFTLNNFYTSTDLQTNTSRLKVLYGIRILANLLSSQPKAYDILLQQLETVWHSELSIVINKLFSLCEKILLHELCWLLRIILELQKMRHNAVEETTTNFLQKLQVPKELLR